MSSRPIPKHEIDAMFRRAKGRDRALFVMLWRAGLRSFEACALHLEDLEFLEDGRLRVHVRRGKGGKSRYVGLHPRWADEVKGWLGILSGLMGGKAVANGWLLPTSSGQPITTSQVRRSIALLGKNAGIRGRVHPHALRHRYARECAEATDAHEMNGLH